MADLEVSVTSLKSMQKTVSTSVSELERLLQEMYTSVKILNNTWEGPNHKEFIEKFEANYENMANLNRSLKAYAKALKKAGSLYEKCEEEVWQIVRGQ